MWLVLCVYRVRESGARRDAGCVRGEALGKVCYLQERIGGRGSD